MKCHYYSESMYRYYQISYRSWLSLAKFSNNAEQLGLEVTDINHRENGPGLVLELSSGNYDYEVHLTDKSLMLGRIDRTGTKVRLCEGTVGTENDFYRMLESVRNSERREVVVWR